MSCSWCRPSLGEPLPGFRVFRGLREKNEKFNISFISNNFLLLSSHSINNTTVTLNSLFSSWLWWCCSINSSPFCDGVTASLDLFSFSIIQTFIASKESSNCTLAIVSVAALLSSCYDEITPNQIRWIIDR